MNGAARSGPECEFGDELVDEKPMFLTRGSAVRSRRLVKRPAWQSYNPTGSPESGNPHLLTIF